MDGSKVTWLFSLGCAGNGSSDHSVTFSTLADWMGKAAWLLRPLADRIAQHVMAGTVIHADDTPVGCSSSRWWQRLVTHGAK